MNSGGKYSVVSVIGSNKVTKDQIEEHATPANICALAFNVFRLILNTIVFILGTKLKCPLDENIRVYMIGIPLNKFRSDIFNHDQNHNLILS